MKKKYTCLFIVIKTKEKVHDINFLFFSFDFRMTQLPLAPFAFVRAQPKQYDIQSNFGMFPGERLIYHGEMKTGCCKLGDQYYTSVTDVRYVARREICICCGCCCKRPYIDQCIYLNDIAQLHETQDTLRCCPWCCTHCDCLTCCCPCSLAKYLELRGAFGRHTIHIYGKDVPDFEFMITEAIAQHKLLNQ